MDVAFRLSMLIFGGAPAIESMTFVARPQAIESPCNKVCTVDPASGLCAGCGRSLSEIANWIGYSDDERAAVMAELPRRLAARRKPAGQD